MDDSQTTLNDLLTLGSLSPAFPQSLLQENIADLERRILAWVGQECEHVTRLAGYQLWDGKLKAAAAAAQAITDTFHERVTPLESDFLLKHQASLIRLRQQGLLAEAQLQVFEGRLDNADLQRLKQALEMVANVEQRADTVYLDLCIADSDLPIELSGVLIVTTAQAASTPAIEDPALLYVPGSGGGLHKFESLQVLKERVSLTLCSGLETPLWRHVSPPVRMRAMSGKVQLLTRAITGRPLGHGVQAQVRQLEASFQAGQSGERFYPEIDSRDDTLIRLYRDMADNLAVPLNEVRDQAIDHIAEQQRTMELAATLPDWLIKAPNDVRVEYVDMLKEYRAAAVLLETHLQQVLPAYEDFAGQCVARRIRQDLKLELDPAQLIIELPKEVRHDIDIAPETPRPFSFWQPSNTWVTQSLAQLACYNLDPDDVATQALWSFARISYPPAPQMPGLHVISGAYLRGIIPALDVTQNYRRLLQEVFGARSSRTAAHAEMKLKPFELEIILNGFTARHRRLLTDAGYNLLQQAARARSVSELNRAGIFTDWLVFKPGQALSGERSETTLQGLCAIRHPGSSKVLVYLPGVPDGNCLIEANSLDEAREYLIQSLLRVPSRIAWLASRVDDAVDRERHEQYINEALRRKFAGFIAFVPAVDLLPREHQFNFREWLHYQQTRLQGRTNQELGLERERQRSRIYLMFLKAGLAFLPGLGVIFSIKDGWDDGHASADALRGGEVGEAVLMAGSTLLSVADVLLSVVPGLAGVAALARTARQATRVRQAARLLGALPSASRKPYVIKPFAGYEIDLSRAGAVPLGGRDSGVWSKDGKWFIYRQDKASEVYRRPGEQTLRLKKTATQGYEPPVRMVDGQWVYHTDVGLKGGVRSWIAEVLISQSGTSRQDARRLLDQFDFPGHEQLRMELDVAWFYQSHRTTPSWAERYRRPAVSEAGPSTSSPGGTRRSPAEAGQSETRSGPEQPVTGPLRLPTGFDNWQGWALPSTEASVLDQISFTPPIFRYNRAPDLDAVRVDSKYFAIMPRDAGEKGMHALIHNRQTPCGTFTQLSEMLHRNIFDQPRLVNFDQGPAQWRMVGILFNQPIENMIEASRPGFTRFSQRVLAEKLYQLSQPGSSQVTANRLLVMNATLKAWEHGGQAPLPTLNDPLLMLSGARHVSNADGSQFWRVGVESAREPFQRLDFSARDPMIAAHLYDLTVDPGTHGLRTLRALMARVLNLNGYEVLGQKLLWRQRSFIVFRRRGQEEVYLLNLRQSRHSIVESPPGEVIAHDQFLDPWLASSILGEPNDPVVVALRQAHGNGKLVLLVGGINVNELELGGTQIFIMRLANNING
ncbi:dermonecrotic toxin domain-containing protein [Pseudomonas sp. Pseusp122]|uniref:dermonecrotic toxin domain-containing protein n=1 Tax=unclassified Pseudomonas TaxID=196821 RepID=UPI0039A58378